MALHLHRSNRTESLVEALVAVVAPPPASPLVPECIVVQGRGMERWLAMRLADRLGVWANAEFPFPRRIVERGLDAVLGPETTEAFEPGSLTWAVAALLPAHVRDPAFASLARYLEGDTTGTRLFELAERIARTFDQYVVYRPAMVRGWERGTGAGWQPTLWRALVARHGARHVAARAAALVAAVEAGASRPAGLPPRISLFGVATLPPLYLQVLVTVARLVEVHLFVLSASGEYWGEIRSRREIIRELQRTGVDPAEAESRLHLVEGHPLLASLGRLGRDFQHILEAGSDYVDDPVDRYVDPGTASMLTALQSDMLHLRHRRSGGAAPPALPLAPDDASIAVHACHGPMREVEVLHDQLLALFDADPTLQPHEVVVMSPALDVYAPFVEAVFGPARSGAPPIPFHVADRGVRAVDESYDAFCRVLDLLPRRFTATEVMDLLELDAVRTRFGIASGDLELARRWVLAAGVRWGIDEEHRAALATPRLRTHTWRFGLDRLLLGQAMTGGNATCFAGVLPYDDVEGSEADLLGRLTSFCEGLFTLQMRLAAPRPLTDWPAALGEVLATTIADRGGAAAEHLRIRRALTSIAERAARAGFDAPVALDTVRGALDATLGEERPPEALLRGGVTFCALVPMRSIPFRVVALLGMSDETFPRSEPAFGFDLAAGERRPGDRARRDDDRYTFLEALLSARERLLITYVGQSIRDNARLPPSVVVSELLDAVEAAFIAPAGGPPPRAHIELRHKLQPFSPAYFRAEGDPRLFSYDQQACAGAASRLGPGRPHPLLLPAALPAPAATAYVALETFERFFEHPIRALLQHQLGLYLGEDATTLEDRDPTVLAGLEAWTVGDRLLERVLAGDDLDDAGAAVAASGLLPPGRLGTWHLSRLLPHVQALAAMTSRLTAGSRLPALDVDLDLEAFRLVGTLGDLWPQAQIHHQYSWLAGRSEIRLWIRHLILLTRARRGDPRETLVLGRDREVDGPAACRFTEVADPRGLLQRLAELYVRGQRVPLPFFARASRAYAEGIAGGTGTALRDARNAFTGSDGRVWGDLHDPYVRRLYAAHDADPFVPLPTAEPGLRFESLAGAVLGPLLDHRRLEVAPRIP